MNNIFSLNKLEAIEESLVHRLSIYFPKDTNDCIVANGKVWGNGEESLYKKLSRVNKYLYEITFNSIDYDYAKKYFEKNCKPMTFGCSSVRNGNFYGRNFDWYYNNEVSFVVKVKANKEGQYDSVGMCGCIPEFTTKVIENKEQEELLKILPFSCLDGINEYGLTCNINVLPHDDIEGGTLSITVPYIEKKDSICTKMIVRYILDNFKTALDAANYIRNYVEVYSSTKLGQEIHVMLADSTGTYVLEFKDDDNFIRRTNILEDEYAMTNFYLSDSSKDSDGHINIDSLTPHSNGIERYNLIIDAYSQLDSKEAICNLMRNTLKYTNAYTQDWDSEWLGKYILDDITIDLTTEELKQNPRSEQFQAIKRYVQNLYENRNRNTSLTWQTVHTSVYDLKDKKLYLTNQEDSNNEYIFNLPSKTSDGDCYKLIKNLQERVAKLEGKVSITINNIYAGFEGGVYQSNIIVNYGELRSLTFKNVPSWITLETDLHTVTVTCSRNYELNKRQVYIEAVINEDESNIATFSVVQTAESIPVLYKILDRYVTDENFITTEEIALFNKITDIISFPKPVYDQLKYISIGQCFLMLIPEDLEYKGQVWNGISEYVDFPQEDNFFYGNKSVNYNGITYKLFGENTIVSADKNYAINNK